MVCCLSLGGDSSSSESQASQEKPCWFRRVLLPFLILFIGMSAAYFYGAHSGQQQQKVIHVTNPAYPSAPSVLTKKTFDWPAPSGSLHAKYKKAALASDHGLCSEIGRDIMIKGGNAIDASIASLLCIGVVNPQSSGLGGGFLMTFYNKKENKCYSVNARETAPAHATKDMFVDKADEAIVGYRSIATPSELHGFWTVFKRFGSGRLSWQSLFAPAARLAQRGFPVSSNLAEYIALRLDAIRTEPTLSELFIRNGAPLVEGDILKRPVLAATLKRLGDASDPVDLFYRGAMAKEIADEIGSKGGPRLSDLSAYSTLVSSAPLLSHSLPGLVICGPPPPSSFVATQNIVAVMAEFYRNSTVDLEDALVYHRLIEAEKFAYAQRASLGDGVADSQRVVERMMTGEYTSLVASLIRDRAQPMNYYTDTVKQQPSDHGTSHLSAIDAEGNAVSCTSTINHVFGSMRRSPTLGLLWNNEMDDFSTPGQVNVFGYAPAEANFIKPGKRPMSSMSPTVVYDTEKGEVRLVSGASGGSFIISATAQSIVRTLLFGQTIKEAVDAPRLHNQFTPFRTDYEGRWPEEMIAILEQQFGQNNMTLVPQQRSTVQAIMKGTDGFIYGNSDFRRQTATYPAGF